MAKSLKDLFENAEIAKSNFYTLETSPAIGGKTMQERYDIRNSKDIKVSSSAPLMGVPFFALNKIRLADNEKTRETFLEEELVGLRTLRGIASPVLYGSDIIRLKLGSTPMVEKMRESAKGNDSNSLTKFGQSIQQTRNEVNDFLGIPKPLNPTQYYKDLEGPAIYDRNKTLLDIRDKAKGSGFGKLLSNSKGNLQTIGTQALGNTINAAKNALTKAVLGNTGTGIISNKYNPTYTNLIRPIQKYSQIDKGNDSYSKKYKNESTDLNNLWNKAYHDKKFPFSTSYLGDRPAPGNENRQNDPAWWNTGALYEYTSEKTYEKGGTRTNDNLKNDSINIARKHDATSGDQNARQTVDVNNLRPGYLKNKKTAAEQPSYSKQKGLKNSNTVYGSLGETLENKRGLGSKRDILNQTGKLTKGELSSVKYNGEDTLEKLDLIPLRFQRVNDGSGIYMRSTITAFSETFTPSWETNKFIGNPFNFYNYTGIERKVAFNFKVYAMSQVELVMMWRRLEYLAHLTYPYGAGNAGIEPALVYFTMGSLYVDKPSIITTLTYNIADSEQLWEIGGNTKGKIIDGNYTTAFDNKFSAGKDNKAPQLKLSGNKSYNANRYQRYNAGQGNEYNYSEEKDLSIQTKTFGLDMNKYKLPKFIDANIEMTFLESFNSTKDNVYDYGKTITTGFTPENTRSTGAAKVKK